MKIAVIGVLAIGVAGCSATTTSELLPPPPSGQGFQASLDTEAAPGEEIWKCKIFHLEADRLQQVNRVKHVQSSTVHHMDIMVLLNTLQDLPDGTYDCKQLYDANPGLMEETNLYASQKASDEILLPTGVVAQVPGGLTMMYEIHVVNASDQRLKISSRTNAYTIPDDDVRGTIFGGVTRDRNINVPANTTRHDEWSRCVFDTDVDVIILTSHTHELGQEFRIRTFDGVNVGPEVFRNVDWQTPMILQLAQPIHVKRGEGFEWTCQYASDRPTPTSWGFAAKDEMCQMVYVYTPGEVPSHCKVVQTSDGVIME